MENGIHTTKEKALSLNLNADIYGTLAEIGGGQEVAANFFKAGGASGTIAKTMSAYDMKFSDAIYGETERYVCEEKLHKMLKKEYALLPERLSNRAETTKFFAFANTVETLNFRKTNQGHGWIGVRFQLTPESAPNDCIIHIVMHDPDAIWQQEVLGRVGVNLIYACFNHYRDPEKLMLSIRDNLSHDRMEVDMFKLEGPDFEHVDNRLMALKLVEHHMSPAAMFDKEGKVQQPSSTLYKKNTCVLRGRFIPVTNLHMDMLEKGINQFLQDEEVEEDRLKVLTELTLKDLMKDGEISESDFLDRVSLLNSLGQHVMISNFRQYYQLASYLSLFNRGMRIGLLMGTDHLRSVFNESRYDKLKGGITESFGRMFGSNVKVLVYPLLKDNGEIETSENFNPGANLQHLYLHLKENGHIEDVQGAETNCLSIDADHVLNSIKSQSNDWKSAVPPQIQGLIEDKEMFLS